VIKTSLGGVDTLSAKQMEAHYSSVFAEVGGESARILTTRKRRREDINRETREHGFFANWFVYFAYFAVTISGLCFRIAETTTQIPCQNSFKMSP
jgi:hypothetical protein